MQRVWLWHSLSVKCYFIFDVCGDQLVKIRNSVNPLKLLELFWVPFSRKSATGMNPDLGGLSINVASRTLASFIRSWLRLQIHPTQTCLAKGSQLLGSSYRTTSEPEATSQDLTGAEETKNCTVARWPCFHMKVNVVFYFEIKALESVWCTESKVFVVQCEVQSDDCGIMSSAGVGGGRPTVSKWV